jgi:hypothetical protein
LNPFIERGRITAPAHFSGRWSELSLLFERLEAGRSVIVTGPPAIGKSSLLTHVMQSAATNMDLPDLHAYYLNLKAPGSAAEVYRVIIEALGQRGNTLAALEVALISADVPVLLCLDDAQVAVSAGWGTQLLEDLARLARGGSLLLVVAFDGASPILSERFATINLGAFASPEVRLLAEAYLDDTGITFTPFEIRALADLSAAHPAYLQRAAFYLFQSKVQPGLDWRAAYLAEARAQPIPGAPLPPEVFEGANNEMRSSTYAEEQLRDTSSEPSTLQLPELDPALLVLVPLLLSALLFLTTGNTALVIIIVVGSVVGCGFLWQRRRAKGKR